MFRNDDVRPSGLGRSATRASRWKRPGLLAGLSAIAATLAAAIARAEDAAPPDLAQRVADLEAYVTNGAPKALVSSGPGHNAWMMTSSALVLFMTLPGLALFYGGLVRRKNVLSVLAQC